MKRKRMLFMAALLAMLIVVSPMQLNANEIPNAAEDNASVEATEVTEVELPTGFRPIEVTEISEEEALELARENADVDPAMDDVEPVEEMTDEEIQEELFFYTESKATHASDSSTWGAYCCDAIYNNMNAYERQFYDNLYADCLSFLTTSKTSSDRFTSGASFTGLTYDQMVNVARIFNYLNPQFFFLNNGFKYSQSGQGNGTVFWGIYDSENGGPDFRNGTERMSARNSMYSKVNTWMTQINAESSDYLKVKKAHDLLCQNVFYTTQTDTDGNPECPYSQTCYSAISLGETVCAGYAEAFELLCNKAGIPTIAVTSDGHEWNQIYMNSVWYIVDVTWDDSDSFDPSNSFYYNHFLKSNSTLVSYGSYTSVNHTLEPTWNAYSVRECLYDWPEPTNGATQSYSNTPTDSVSGASTNTSSPTGVSMYRLYNPNSGEHLFSGNWDEVQYLVPYGWIYEGVAFNAATSGGTPVYRLYNPNSGDHHYSNNWSEVEYLVPLGWNYEGIAFYSADSRTRPIYRLFNPNETTGTHHLTTSWDEVEFLVPLGWVYEGILFYSL